MTAPSDTSPGQTSSPRLIAPILEPADYTQYLLRSKNEILSVLRSLRAAGDQITVYFNQGQDFLLSAVIALTDEEITLDFGSSTEMNRRALTAEKLFGVASHERVRIQFLLRSLREVVFEGRPAFRAALPESLLRLQRREYYRLTAPVVRPLKCKIPLPSANGVASQTIDVNIIDISGGGLAVMAPPMGISFAPEMTFANCRIELPEVGVLTATLQVRSIFEVTLRNGAPVSRAGCQFINLPGPMLTLVQRYIIKVERERKARESGMA